LHIETKLFALVLAVLNLPLLWGRVAESFVFRPDAVTDGQWWRLVLHPFVHASWYHLLLDAGTFLMLYEALHSPSWKRRLGYVFFAGLGSLSFAWWFSPSISAHGLCGLSGVAHGLMAVSGLEMMTIGSRDTVQKRLGLGLLLMVAGKAAWEWITGISFLGLFHFGLMGTPLVACHAGGVVGGVVGFMCRTR